MTRLPLSRRVLHAAATLLVAPSLLASEAEAKGPARAATARTAAPRPEFADRSGDAQWNGDRDDDVNESARERSWTSKGRSAVSGRLGIVDGALAGVLLGEIALGESFALVPWAMAVLSNGTGFSSNGSDDGETDETTEGPVTTTTSSGDRKGRSTRESTKNFYGGLDARAYLFTHGSRPLGFRHFVDLGVAYGVKDYELEVGDTERTYDRYGTTARSDAVLVGASFSSFWDFGTRWRLELLWAGYSSAVWARNDVDETFGNKSAANLTWAEEQALSPHTWRLLNVGLGFKF